MLRLLPLCIGRRHESGSAWLLQNDSGGLLLDAGSKPPVGVEDVGMIFVSHGHVDHVGGLIDFVERFPHARRVTSSEVLQTLEAVLVNELKLRGGNTSRAHAIVDTFEAQKFHAPFKFNDMELTLLPAGHVPGSAMLLAEVPIEGGSHRLLYTGDWSPFVMPGIQPVAWPTSVKTLVLESALAAHLDLDAYTFEDAQRELQSLEGALVLASPIGEAQLVWEILKAQENFCVHENLRGFLPTSNFGTTQDCIRVLKHSGVVLAAGKELDFNTPSRAIVQSIMDNSTRSVRMVNGVKSRSLGDQFLHSGKRSKVPGLGRRKVHTSILNLTLHAPAIHLMRAVEELSPRKVVLTHQDEKNLHAFGRRLSKYLGSQTRTEIIVPGHSYIDLEPQES